MREAGWILLLAAGTYLALILFTYSRSDPGPSFSGAGAPILNKGGAAGAWFADAFYYLFGLSAWWWVGLALFGILRMYRRVEAWEILNRRTLAVSLVGFAVVLASSTALESMRLHSLGTALGFPSGGALGAVLASGLAPLLGFTGATLLLLALLAGGLSLFTGLSWLRVAELLGGAIEWAYAMVKGRIEARRDREEGRLAAQEREEKVEVAKKAFEDHEPIRIEMPSPVIAKSERIAREKQVPLFAELPDSPLPALGLLDPPDTHIERPTAETLEYTSRLIERKLLDFNVQVKVVAAYPGPVITRYEIEPAVGVDRKSVV